MKIAKIVSGGQTGADRGGWEAALYCQIPIGGWVPRGRKAEDGFIPAKYTDLRETEAEDYKVRTEANVVDSEATVVFCYGPPTGGSKWTVAFAKKHHRPCLTVDLNTPRDQVVKAVVDWLQTKCPAGDGVLNVAGTRGTKAPSIQQAVMARMVDVISVANGRMLYPLGENG